MSDLNWCTYCDNAISPYSESLYCDERCLEADALRSHPLLGYNWHEFEDFPKPTRSRTLSPSLTTSSSTSSSSSAVQTPSHFDFLFSSPDSHLTTNKAPSLVEATIRKA